MRPPTLEPVTLTAFITLMRYAYRSMPYIGCQLESTKTIVGTYNIVLIMGNIQPNPTLHPNLTSYGPQLTPNVEIMRGDYSYIFKNRYPNIVW